MSTKKIDALYLKGIGQDESFSFYWTNLRPLLLKYARTIGRQSTSQVEDHLIDEMVDDLLMEISEFKGYSQFSTWAYVRFRRRWIDEYRYQSGNLGYSLDSLIEDWQAQTDLDEEVSSPYEPSHEPDTERQVIVGDFAAKRLSPRQRIIWEAYRDGHTQEEIGESLSITQQRVDQIWQQILTLAKEYGAAC